MGMSNAERQRRFIARLKKAAKAGTTREADARIRELEARVRNLEAQLARERKRGTAKKARR